MTSSAVDQFPRRFRRRLTIAFVAVAALAAGVVAVGSYLAIREYRHDEFLEHSRREAQLNLALAPDDLGASDIEQLLDTYRRRGGFETVVVLDDASYASRAELDESAPVRAAEQDGAEAVTEARAVVEGHRYRVLSGSLADSDARLHFFFSEEPLWQGLAEFRNVLAVSWALVVLVAALIGHQVARRTLAPVRRAADAAGALAEGLLTTRLPVQTDDEFGVWASYFNDMAQALEQKIEALAIAHERERRFTADVAHELRTPLGAMVTAASVIEQQLGDIPAEMRRPIELLVGDVARLRQLVIDLLELSRLDAGEEVVQPDSIALGHLAAGVLRSTGCEDVVDLDVEEVHVYTDPRRVERILGNLVTNAVKHGGRDVTMSVRPGDDGATVVVRDRGEGIAPDQLGKIFDRFYKADAARSAVGSGLGLAIVAENARLLRADLGVSSEPGEGATFTLDIPNYHDGDTAAPQVI